MTRKIVYPHRRSTTRNSGSLQHSAVISMPKSWEDNNVTASKIVDYKTNHYHSFLHIPLLAETISHLESTVCEPPLQRMDIKVAPDLKQYAERAKKFHETLVEIKKDKELMQDFYVNEYIDDAIGRVKTFANSCEFGMIAPEKVKESWEKLYIEIDGDYFYGSLGKAVKKLREKVKIQEPPSSEQPKDKEKVKGPKTEKAIRNRLKDAEITAEQLFKDGTWQIGDVIQAYRSNWDNKTGCFSIKIKILGTDASKFVIHAHVIRQLHIPHKPWDIASSGGGGAVHVKKTTWNQIEGQDNEDHLRLSLEAVMNTINSAMIQKGYNLLPNKDKDLKKF
jgi:hypothetical protein